MRATRRQFLRWGATGLVAASVAPVACSPGSRPEGGPSSAVVIGAGLSGLVTAHLLSQGSTQVTVLDAHGHAGGRVITDRWPNGQISEAGFEEFFEQDTYPDVWWLIDELGLGDQVTPYRGSVGAFLRDEYVGPRGYSQWISDLPWQGATDAADFNQMTSHVSNSVGLLSMPADAEEYASLDTESMRDWISRSYDRSGSGDVDWLTSIFLKPEVGVPSDRSSAAYAILNLWIWFNSDLYHLRDGNDQLISQLIDRLPPDAMTLEAEVTTVQNLPGNDGVEVQYTDRSGSHTVRADVAIVAVPHPVVSRIVPGLPAERKQALARLDFARVIRHSSQYSERVWETEHGFSGSGLYTDQTATWITNSPPGDFESGVLAAYVNEPAASDLWTGPVDVFTPHHLVDEDQGRPITDRLHGELASFWPGLDPVLSEARIWQVPYYGPVYPPRYVLDGDYALNQEPLGRIHFGGDWVYGFGANDAVRRARDLVSALTT
ncbi:MAG: NAD(P)-binding protein [Actinomycetia bacterium]|nr:NAD(P)-binding protein [Actinomycetes bacterium]